MNRRAASRLPRPRHGFTLVELLVAILAFGLLAAAAYTGLNGLANSSGILHQRADDLAALQRAVAALDQDLRQLVSRAAATPDGALRPALAGTPSGWQGHRAGRWSATPDGSALQTVAWRCTGDGALERRATPGAGGSLGPGGPARAYLHAIGCGTLRLRYRDAVGQWHARWPIDERPERLPRAVEYRIDSRNFGEIRRLIAL